MAGITLDADQNQEFLEKQLKKEAANHGNIPDSISNISKRKIREVYIPPEELDELRELYSKVIVQDFEDEYHMSKEERESLQKRFSKFFRLKRNFAKKIRRLDKYIEACRLVFEIINDTAEENGVMDKDVFITDVLRGKITIEGLTIPKYVGKGKKTLNWDYIMEYIIDPTRDVKELIASQESSKCKDLENEDDDISLDDIPKDAYEAIMQEIDNYKPPTKSFYDGSDGEGYATIESDSQRKKLVKLSPGYSRKLKELYNNGKPTRGNSYLWQIEDEDSKWIREFKEYKEQKEGDFRPEFTGSIMDSDAVGRYLYELDEWERDHDLVKYGQAMITREQKDQLDLKGILESNGYNLRNLYGNKERLKKLDKARSIQSKKIKSLKAMLSELNKEQKSTNLEGLNGSIKAIDLGGDKVNKKKKKKDKKKPKGKKAKKMQKDFESVLLDAVGSNDKDMKAYEKRMTNMLWEAQGGDK